jgi:hypothetical protein
MTVRVGRNGTVHFVCFESALFYLHLRLRGRLSLRTPTYPSGKALDLRPGDSLATGYIPLCADIYISESKAWLVRAIVIAHLSYVVFNRFTNRDVLSHHCQQETAGHLVSSGKEGNSLDGGWGYLLLLHLRDLPPLSPLWNGCCGGAPRFCQSPWARATSEINGHHVSQDPLNLPSQSGSGSRLLYSRVPWRHVPRNDMARSEK